MGKCLVTTLDVVVSNPDLPKLGELVIPFKAGSAVSLKLSSDVAGNNVSINKTKFSNHETNSVDFGTTAVTVNYGGDEDCVIRIKNKYLLTRFELVSGDVDFIDGMFDYITCGVNNATRIYVLPGSYGLNVETIMKDKETPKVVSMYGTGMSGDMSNLSVWPTIKCYDSPKLVGKPYSYYGANIIELTNTASNLSLTDISSFASTLTTLNFSGSANISGDINTLGSCKGVTAMNFGGTSISGSLEELGSLQYAAGRTSSFIRVTCNGIITMLVDGVATPVSDGVTKYIRFSANGYTITDN